MEAPSKFVPARFITFSRFLNPERPSLFGSQYCLRAYQSTEHHNFGGCYRFRLLSSLFLGSRPFKMTTELLEVWLKRDRALARHVGAYLVCDPLAFVLIGMPIAF